MNELTLFKSYAAAFEESYTDDHWERLDKYFADDTRYDAGDGQWFTGKAAVIRRLQSSVESLDRRFEHRTLTTEPGVLEEHTVSYRWGLTLAVTGAPYLMVSGTEHIVYKGDKIVEMQDVFDDEVIHSLQRWMSSFGSQLSDR